MTLLPMGSVTKFRCLSTSRGVTNLLSSTSPIPARRGDIVVLGQPLVEVSLSVGSHNHNAPLCWDSRRRQDRDGDGTQNCIKCTQHGRSRRVVCWGYLGTGRTTLDGSGGGEWRRKKC